MNKARLGWTIPFTQVEFEPVKFITSAFQPGGVYIPWFGPSEPSGTPATKEIYPGVPGLEYPAKFEPETYSLKLPEFWEPLTPEEPAPWSIEKGFGTLENPFGIPTITPSPSLPTGKSFMENIWDVLGFGVDTFLKYTQAKAAGEYGTALAKSQSEAYKAQAAIAEAQARIVQSQVIAKEREQGWKDVLSAESLKKVAPYLIPVALGLVVVMVLSARGKKI